MESLKNAALGMFGGIIAVTGLFLLLILALPLLLAAFFGFAMLAIGLAVADI